jgi:hypothetical protein
VTCCTGCDGQGWTLAEEWDDLGRYAVNVRCEACDGQGELAECVECREPMPPSGDAVCGGCRVDLERADQAAETARIARVA